VAAKALPEVMDPQAFGSVLSSIRANELLVERFRIGSKSWLG